MVVAGVAGVAVAGVGVAGAGAAGVGAAGVSGVGVAVVAVVAGVAVVANGTIGCPSISPMTIPTHTTQVCQHHPEKRPLRSA